MTKGPFNKALGLMLVEMAFLDTLSAGKNQRTITESNFLDFTKKWFPSSTLDLLDIARHFLPYEFENTVPSKLISAFSTINSQSGAVKQNIIKPLTSDFLVPLPQAEESQYQFLLRNHVEAFRTACLRLPLNDTYDLYQRLFPLFKTYVTNVAAFIDIPQNPVSLFDQHKLRVVFDDPEADIHIVDFDLSGIQPFIYSITEGSNTKPKIAKSLRGRSFYLMVLTNHIGNVFLQRFGLPYEYFLNTSSGKGTIAIPHTSETERDIREVERDIEAFFFHKFQLTLSISFSVRQVRKEQMFTQSSYKTIMQQEALSFDKKHKFSSILSSLKQEDIQKQLVRCPLCGMATSNEELCPICLDSIAISEFLTRHKQMTITSCFNKIDSMDALQLDLGALGHIRFEAANEAPIHLDEWYCSYNHHGHGEVQSYPFVFARGQSFEEIAAGQTGDDKLAVLKMDVDNLGHLFVSGFSQPFYGYSQFMTLSQQMDHFFKQELANICDDASFDHRIYISYAGGDDLVIVCPASLVPALLIKINMGFKLHVCENPALHMSAGIEIFHPRSPIRQAVKFAERQLEKAKSQPGKDHFSLLGSSISNQLLIKVAADAEKFITKYESGNLSKSFIRLLYSALDDSLSQPDSKLAFYPHVPHIAYSINRNVKFADDQQWLKNIFVTTEIDLAMIQRYHTTLALAIMQIRNKKED